MTQRIDIAITHNRVYDSAQAFIENITDLVNAFTFTSTAQGGYATALLTLACDEVTAWRILSEYVGKRVVFTNPLASNAEMIVWEGMLFTATVDDGATATSRTVANLYNRVKVTYSTISYATTPPTLGEQVTTAIAEVTGSQSLYGIRELHYVIGGATAATAEALRDTLLEQYRRVLASPVALRRGIGAEVTMTLECVGWWESLDKRFYTSSNTNNANIDVTIKSCLTSVGQFVNSNQSGIASNSRQRSQYSQGNTTAQALLNGLCQLGGTNNRRYYLQLLYNALPFYFEEPTTPMYRTRRLDPSEAIYNVNTGREVPPWLVLPGRIIEVVDLLPDELNYNVALDNARAFVIGETRFTAPNSLELVPLVRDPAQLQLARMGLTEIG